MIIMQYILNASMAVSEVSKPKIRNIVNEKKVSTPLILKKLDILGASLHKKKKKGTH